MPDVMLKLGSYTFSVATAAYGQLSRSTDYRWKSQELVGARENLQYVGPGSETITLAGVVYPHYRGGLGQIDAMRAEAGRGVPLLLVDGLGRVHGRFVIEKIDEQQDAFMRSGVPRKQQFSLSLRRFDDLASLQRQPVGDPLPLA